MPALNLTLQWKWLHQNIMRLLQTDLTNLKAEATTFKKCTFEDILGQLFSQLIGGSNRLRNCIDTRLLLPSSCQLLLLCLLELTLFIKCATVVLLLQKQQNLFLFFSFGINRTKKHLK